MKKTLENVGKAIQAKEVRGKIGMTREGLSQVSGIPVVTIESYEYMKRETPTSYLDRLQELYERDQEVMRQIKIGIEAELDRIYPNGIPSERVEISE